MNLLANLDHLYDECRRNQWLRYFAVFCRVAFPVGKHSIAIIDSLERAITEAKGRVAWLSHEA
jgi:hypothetical protein